MLGINSEHGDEDLSEELEELFKALGNINRLILIYSLASGEKEKFSVTEMAKMMGLTQPAASQHLKVLKNCKDPQCKKARKLHLLHLQPECPFKTQRKD